MSSKEGLDGAGAIGRGSAADLGRTVARGGAWTIGGRLARSLIGLAGIAVLARLLAPADFGVMAFTVAAGVLTLTMLEGFIDMPAIRHDELTRDGLASLIWVATGCLAAAGLALWLAAPALEHALDFPRLALGLRAAVPVMLVQVLSVAGAALLRRAHRFRAAALIGAGTTLLYYCGAIGLALLGFGLAGLLAAQIVSAMAGAAMLARAARLPLAPPRRLDLAHVGGTGGYGALAMLLGWAQGTIDTVAVAASAGPAATGIYARAYNIDVQFKEPFGALNQALRPALAALSDQPERFDREVVRLLALTTLISAPLAAWGAAASDELTGLLLGSKFTGAGAILAVLLAAFPIKMATMTADAATISGGRMPHLPMRNALTFGLIAAGALLAAPSGVLAVAAVVAGAHWAGGILTLFLYGGARPIGRPPHYLALLPGLAAAALLWLAERALLDAIADESLLLRLTASGALLAACYVLLFLLIPERAMPGIVVRLRRNLVGRSAV